MKGEGTPASAPPSEHVDAKADEPGQSQGGDDQPLARESQVHDASDVERGERDSDGDEGQGFAESAPAARFEGRGEATLP